MIDGTSIPMTNRQQHNSPLILSLSKGLLAYVFSLLCNQLFLLCISAVKKYYVWSPSFHHQALTIKNGRKAYHLTS